MRTRLLMARNFLSESKRNGTSSFLYEGREERRLTRLFFTIRLLNLVTRACMSKSTRLKIQKIPVLPFTSGVSFRKLFAFLNPQFSHL